MSFETFLTIVAGVAIIAYWWNNPWCFGNYENPDDKIHEDPNQDTDEKN